MFRAEADTETRVSVSDQPRRRSLYRWLLASTASRLVCCRYTAIPPSSTSLTYIQHHANVNYHSSVGYHGHNRWQATANGRSSPSIPRLRLHPLSPMRRLRHPGITQLYQLVEQVEISTMMDQFLELGYSSCVYKDERRETTFLHHHIHQHPIITSRRTSS